MAWLEHSRGRLTAQPAQWVLALCDPRWHFPTMKHDQSGVGICLLLFLVLILDHLLAFPFITFIDSTALHSLGWRVKKKKLAGNLENCRKCSCNFGGGSSCCTKHHCCPQENRLGLAKLPTFSVDTFTDCP